MGKIIDTDDLMMNVEFVIQKFKESRGTAAISEHDLNGIREAYSMLCAMTRPAGVPESTELIFTGNLGEKLRIRTCGKCHGKILSVVGTDDYSFCPICGRRVIKSVKLPAFDNPEF